MRRPCDAKGRARAVRSDFAFDRVIAATFDILKPRRRTIFGSIPSTQSLVLNLLEILEARSGPRSTVETPWLPTNHWREVFRDPACADNFLDRLDRLVHHVHPIELSSETLRRDRQTKIGVRSKTA
ncbi:ATP-binding protein [Methylocystis sp.]|uniref:ATP-binding protein n=1 Tax=Methylocystis sp. TaxID=1911079 RepID=UPI003D0B1E47